MQSDAELVNATLNGKKDAFAVLVKRYERPVRAVAMNVLGNHTSAQDAVQDAFVRAYEKLPHLRKAEAFGPWLMKITRRCALSMVRQRPGEMALDCAHASTIESKDGRLDEEKQELLAAVMKLPKAEKQVVTLRYFTGQSVKDVAKIVSRSVGTITKQLSRAHKRLRKMLKES